MEELLERKKGLHRTILIVDDEIIEREMLGAMLQDSYTVIYAENGAVALQNSRHSYEDGIGAGPVFRRADGYSDAGDGRLYGGENDPCAAG